MAMDRPRELEHALKNYLAIILGFAELLLHDAAPDDPRLADLREIHKAATAAVDLVTRLGADDA